MMNKPPTAPMGRSSRRRSGAIGALIGSIGLAGALVAVASGAGAAAPGVEKLAPVAAQAQPVEGVDVVADTDWEAFDGCMSAALEAAGFELDTAAIVEEVELDGLEALEDLDADFEVFDLGDLPPMVEVIDGDGIRFAEFGEGDGTVTITKTGDQISVETDGDVQVEELDLEDLRLADELDLDDELEAEFEAAVTGCEDRLPEGVWVDDILDEDDGDEDDDEQDGDAADEEDDN